MQATKIDLQLSKQSHWFGSRTSKECSKSEHLNRGEPVPSAPTVSKK